MAWSARVQASDQPLIDPPPSPPRSLCLLQGVMSRVMNFPGFPVPHVTQKQRQRMQHLVACDQRPPSTHTHIYFVLLCPSIACLRVKERHLVVLDTLLTTLGLALSGALWRSLAHSLSPRCYTPSLHSWPSAKIAPGVATAFFPSSPPFSTFVLLLQEEEPSHRLDTLCHVSFIYPLSASFTLCLRRIYGSTSVCTRLTFDAFSSTTVPSKKKRIIFTTKQKSQSAPPPPNSYHVSISIAVPHLPSSPVDP